MMRTVWMLLLTVPSVSTASRGQEPPLEGYWQGAVVRDGTVLPMSLQFESTGASVLVDVPTFGSFGQPATASREGSKLSVPFGIFVLILQISSDRGALRGRMEHRRRPGNSMGAVELLRVARPPIPKVKAKEVRFQSADGVTLAATVVVPEKAGKHPGIVFVQGRSYGGRNQHRSHAIAAARRGIASVFFDGRGVGGSGGKRGRHTLENRLDDAEAALKFLRGHKSVDPKRVGLFGHSAGGWVVPVVARRAGPVAFLILHAGPAESLADQQGHVVREQSKMSGGMSDADLNKAFVYQRRLVEMTIAGASWPEIDAHVQTARGQSWAKRVDLPQNNGDAELDYFRRNPHDNVPALRETKIPLLALYGGDDFIVGPQFNVPKLREHMQAAGNEDHRIVVFPGAGHDLMLAGDGKSWRRRPPGYFDTIFDWLLPRVAR